jgi:hypothetical protein
LLSLDDLDQQISQSKLLVLRPLLEWIVIYSVFPYPVGNPVLALSVLKLNAQANFQFSSQLVWAAGLVKFVLAKFLYLISLKHPDRPFSHLFFWQDCWIDFASAPRFKVAWLSQMIHPVILMPF